MNMMETGSLNVCGRRRFLRVAGALSSTEFAPDANARPVFDRSVRLAETITGRAKVTRMHFLPSAATSIAAMLLLLSHSAEAQVAESGYSLPLSLAVEAATEAIRSCEAHGYAVSASVVDTSGVVKVQLKGDHSTVHTQDTSFRKAYTLVTFGPIFNLDKSTQIAELAKNPAGPGPALTSIPNVLALAGGVAIKRDNEIVATLGVGGSPGGAKDEACAEAGVAKIHDRVEAAAAPRSGSADVKK
jgi:uncharacterized protein GlcG (DUF336 family)